MRIDHQLAEKWIKPDSSVLDLGCGDGELLAHMSKSTIFAHMDWKLIKKRLQLQSVAG